MEGREKRPHRGPPFRATRSAHSAPPRRASDPVKSALAPQALQSRRSRRVSALGLRHFRSPRPVRGERARAEGSPRKPRCGPDRSDLEIREIRPRKAGEVSGPSRLWSPRPGLPGRGLGRARVRGPQVTSGTGRIRHQTWQMWLIVGAFATLQPAPASRCGSAAPHPNLLPEDGAKGPEGTPSRPRPRWYSRRDAMNRQPFRATRSAHSAPPRRASDPIKWALAR
jgi:hypothetical protein